MVVPLTDDHIPSTQEKRNQIAKTGFLEGTVSFFSVRGNLAANSFPAPSENSSTSSSARISASLNTSIGGNTEQATGSATILAGSTDISSTQSRYALKRPQSTGGTITRLLSD